MQSTVLVQRHEHKDNKTRQLSGTLMLFHLFVYLFIFHLSFHYFTARFSCCEFKHAPNIAAFLKKNFFLKTTKRNVFVLDEPAQINQKKKGQKKNRLDK